MSYSINIPLHILYFLAAQAILVVAVTSDRLTLLTHGLEDWSEEGSGLADGSDLLTDHREEPCVNSAIAMEHRNYILYTHNRLRSKLAQGRQPNKDGMMGSGKNIYLVKWDCDLERFARSWTLSCPSFPVPAAKMPAGSQLARQFIFDFHGTNATEHIDDSMRSWWLEYKRHGNLDHKNRYYLRQNYYGWANMAKGKNSRIGCSYIICDHRRAIFTCAYSTKAHIEKRTIYEPGQPCSVDDDCSTYPNSRCISSLGLCQAPKPPKDKNANRMCGGLNTKMTDYARKTALELHNFYRSRLARGLEFNGETNTFQRGAKNMIKLEYDCSLEKYAQTWADGCRFVHSNNWERPNQGQNLYMTTIRSWETSALLHTALEIWWKELEEFGMPSDAFLSEEVWTKKGELIGHFTQMACGKSSRLGCAITTCSDMEYVVCHYSPGGNRKEHPVYELGSHCRTDFDCPSNFYCIEKEGLCAVQQKFLI